jgi:multiple sugar transport system substrate-binding protein
MIELKKLSSWLMAIVMSILLVVVFSVGGCKPTPPEETTAAAETTAAEETTAAAETTAAEVRPYEGQTITFLFYAWETYSPEVLQRFTDLTGIIVEPETLGYDELDTKIIASSAAGVIPADVFTQYEGNIVGLAGTGYLEPLDEYVSDKEDLIGLDGYRQNGALVGVPLGGNIYIGIVNTAKLSEAGFNEPPKTMDELVEMCLKIKELGIDEYPFSIPLVADGGSTKNWYLINFALGGELFDENYQPLFVSETGYKALELMVDNLGVIIDPAMVDTSDVDITDMFPTGRGVFCLGGYSSLLQFADPSFSKIADDMGPMLIPGSKENRSGTIYMSDGLCVSSLSKNKGAAGEFIKYCLSDETLTAQFTNASIPPPKKSLLATLEEQGLLKFGDYASEQAKYTKELYPGGIPLWDTEWQNESGAIINSAARGTITIQEALQKMADLALELQKK